MNEPTRRVFNALAGQHTGLTVLDLCEASTLWAADVVAALDALVARGWVRKSGELFFQCSPRAASVDQVIDRHMGDLGND